MNPQKTRKTKGGLRRVLRIYGYLCGYLVAAVFWILVLAKQPLLDVAADDPIASPPYPEWIENQAAPIWCVVSATAREKHALLGTFDKLETGRWWTNILVHAQGGVRLIDVERLSWPPPAEVHVLVLTRAAQSAMESRLDGLDRFVRQGGLLILDNPGHSFLKVAGAEEVPLAQREHMSPSLDHARETVRLNDFYDAAKKPILPRLALEVAPLSLTSGCKPAITGQAQTTSPEIPVIWTCSQGEGGILATSFDLAGTMVRYIQGSPNSDFSFDLAERTGALAEIPVPADMVQHNPAFDQPVLDVLERRVWAAATDLVPLPGWWDFPGGAPGAYLCTHDEEGFGDRSVFMAQEEEKRGVAATYFVLPEPISASGLKTLVEAGAEVAHHWHRGFGGGNTVEKRLGPLILKRKALDLETQKKELEARLGSRLPPITRIHGLQWDPDFDTTFKRMVAAGFRLDSSYGPYGDLGPFPFGSVQPFRPLDRGGRLLPILELPFVLQDDEAAPTETLRRVVAVGASRNLPIVPIFHVNTMDYKPSVGPLEAWLEGFQRAREAGLWLGTVGEYLHFLEGREQSSMVLERLEDGGWAGKVDARGKDLWLDVPVRDRGRGLIDVLMDGERPAGHRCIRQSPSRELLIFAVPKGLHQLRVIYGEGAALCDSGMGEASESGN